MKTFIYLIIFLASIQPATAQIEDKYSKKPSEGFVAKYYQDFLNFLPNKGNNTRVDVYMQVPYTTIQFLKTQEGFEGDYSATVSVFDEDKEKLLVEKSWEEKIDTKDFDQTNSKGNYNLSFRSFYLTPGKYFIRTSVEDEDSKKSFSSENMFNVRDLSGDVSISDILLINKLTQINGHNKILPNISKNVNFEKDGIPMFFEVYSKYSQNAEIRVQIKDGADKDVYTQTLNKYLDSGRTQIIDTIKADTSKNIAIGLGQYTIHVTVLDSAEENKASTDKVFLSRWVGIPAVINNLDKAISELIYIATPSELGYIKDAPDQKEKIKRYLEFWKKKDPTPNTDENEIFNEYYRRVAYANANFSQYVDGWRSDRGMVFILLGSPDNIDRHPFDLDSKPYEVWYYYNLNRSYVFVDETGFGDYRLTTPLYGDDYRYRN